MTAWVLRGDCVWGHARRRVHCENLVCALKLLANLQTGADNLVAPFVGANPVETFDVVRVCPVHFPNLLLLAQCPGPKRKGFA